MLKREIWHKIYLEVTEDEKTKQKTQHQTTTTNNPPNKASKPKHRTNTQNHPAGKKPQHLSPNTSSLAIKQ